MEYTTLGRTGLRVSVAGLGSGGHSRLGQATGKSEQESIKIIHTALDFGINFFDTSRDYKTEKLLAKALKNLRREHLVLSTKERSHSQGEPITPEQLRKALEESLRNLGTDYVDIYHLASLQPGDYLYAFNELVPVLLKSKEQGKVRFIGVSEKFDTDTEHHMLERALRDDCWDVVMAGFNIINQSAREKVFQKTRQKNIGVLGMFAVRRTLSRQENLKQAMFELKAKGLVEPHLVDDNDPLGFLFHDRGALSLQDAAYRYCRHEPGLDVVLFGTGNLKHLEANVNSLLRPPLPDDDWHRLKELFLKVEQFSGN
ncbi:MAG: aldo/keto reductase [Symploca sp. SIO2E9]|nr:aldo/keto reductase [Symploca sp. SIO2E9]